MANPTPFTPAFSFTSYVVKPGQHLNIMFNDIEFSIGEVIEAVKDVRRSDGALNNGIVTFDSLAADVRASIGGDNYLEVISANIDDITTVAGDLNGANVTGAVGADLVGQNTIGTVADKVADIAVVAGDLSGSNNIATVAQGMADIQAVAGIVGSVSATAANEVNINAVASNQANIDAVAAIDADISAVAANEENINAVAEELLSISSKLNTDGGNVSDGPQFLSNIGAQPNLGWVPVEVIELTSSALALVIEVPAGARALRLTGQVMLPNIDDVGRAQLSFDGGATYEEGATDYEYHFIDYWDEYEPYSAAGQSSSMEIIASGSDDAVTPVVLDMRVDAAEGLFPRFQSNVYQLHRSAAPNHGMAFLSGACRTAGVPTHLRLFALDWEGGAGNDGFAVGTRILVEAF